MSISSALTALQSDITAARSAITTKGGTVTSGGGSSQLATDIATIPTGSIPIVGVSGTIYPQLPAGDYKLFVIFSNMPNFDPDTLVVSDYPCDFSNDYGLYGRAAEGHPLRSYKLEANEWVAVGSVWSSDVQITSVTYMNVEIANYAIVNLTNRDSYVQTKYYPAYLIDYFDKASS